MRYGIECIEVSKDGIEESKWISHSNCTRVHSHFPMFNCHFGIWNLSV